MAQNVDDSEEKLMEDGNKTFRIYIGNLNPKVDEGTLRGLFEERGISVCSILVKGKFAFADCSEEEIVERAIIELHGFELMGSRMQVEPSTSRRRKSNKIQVKNLHLPKDELENFIASFHFPNVDKIEQAGAEGVVYVTFGNPEDAQLALARINDFDLNGNTLKADFANNRTKRAPREMPHQNGVSNNQQRPASASSLPLRVLVGSEFIGAIIGKEGQTISQITSSTNTKIDIHRKEGMNRRDAMMSSEPVTPITISGTPENASAALKEMMQIVHAEAKNKGYNKIDYPIKLICPNNICGRIIGKQGNVIKKFMEETQTHIVVSKAEDMMIDRIVTISGPLENACKAESILSEKMRKCQEQDNQHYMNMTMYSGMPPRRQGMMPGPPGPPFMGYHSAMIPPYPPYMHEGFYSGMYGMPQLQGQPTETINLYIPGNVVGSIIGSKGANAKELHQKTGAKIKIERDSGERSHDSERKCAITGTSANRGYALIEIFDKIRKEGGFAKIEDVTLRAEFQVPKEMIGRIIGKKGQNVRELQKVNSCVVKLPDLQDQNASDEEVAVSVTGDLYAILAAQRRILQICEDARRPKIKMVH